MDDVAAGHDAANRTTVGTVQKEIKVGMSGAEVAAALGSPNIVTTDDMRRETWIYDKISSRVSYSKSSGGIGASALLIFGGSEKSSGASERSQRTLTVIIKFDEGGKVRDFAYHTSRF
jgi:outer membrane protein assembly factor BamE (lipoprotein component of BamABCDE complex)